MAYEAVNQEDEQKVQQGFGTQGTQNTNLTTQAENVPTLGGQQSNLVQGQAAQQTQQVTGGQMSGGQKSSGMGARLSNLKKYIEANRGSGMAQGIQKGIEDIRTGVQKGIGESEQKLQTGVAGEKARLSKGEQLIKASNEGGGGVFEKGRSEAYTQDITPAQPQAQVAATGTEGIQPQPVQQPQFQEFGQTAADRLAAFSKYRTGEAQQFDIENQAQLETQAKELQKRANLAQSEAGRYQLLRETFGRPAYTTGQQRLDQLLLQAAPEESGTLQKMTQTIAQPVQEQMKKLQDLRSAENLAIKSQAQGLAGQIGTGLGTERQAFESDIQKRIADEQARAATQYEQARQILSAGGDVNADVLRAAGVSDQAKIDEFLKYYQQGQGQTLGQKVQSGGSLGDQDLQMLHSAVAPTTNFEDFKKAYTENTNNFRGTVQEAIKNASGGFLDYRSQGPAVGVSQFLSAYDPNRITAATVSNAQDLARYQALQQLAAEQGGLLQSGMQFGEGAGRIGQFDIGGALAALREYYNPATTDQYARVSAAPVAQTDIITQAEQAALGTVGTLTGGAEKIAAPVTSIVPGGTELSSALMQSPTMATTPVIMGTGETGRAYLNAGTGLTESAMSGDVLGTTQAGWQFANAPVTGGLAGATTGVQTGEQLASTALTGADKLANVIPFQQTGLTSSLVTAPTQASIAAASKNIQSLLGTGSKIATGDIKTLTNVDTLKTLSGLNLASDTGKLVVNSVNKGVEAAKETWNKASKAVTQVFCFLKDSQVLMEDGSRKSIQDIEPGDFVFGGGLVLIAGRAITDELFCHDGVFVSGSHSTFENGSWKKVRNSELAKSVDDDRHLVYNLVTANHLLVVGKKLYTDFVEFHGADLCSSEDEVIEKLNSDKTLAQDVQEKLDEFLYKKIQ